VRHHESYQGRPIVLTTKQTDDGSWAWEAEVPDESISSLVDGGCRTEEEALGAARSAAAATIDRARTSRGKP
jgi:hypothetical protein